MNNKPANKIWKPLIILLAIGAVIAVGFAARDEAKRKLLAGPVSEPVKSNAPSDYLVKKIGYSRCQDKVTTMLLTPATAKYPDKFTYSISADKHFILIQSYVDCQNVYGAMLRTDWVGKIGYQPEKPDNYNDWSIDALLITK